MFFAGASSLVCNRVASAHLRELRDMAKSDWLPGGLPQSGFVRQSQLIPRIVAFLVRHPLAQGQGRGLPSTRQVVRARHCVAGRGHPRVDPVPQRMNSRHVMRGQTRPVFGTDSTSPRAGTPNDSPTPRGVLKQTSSPVFLPKRSPYETKHWC